MLLGRARLVYRALKRCPASLPTAAVDAAGDGAGASVEGGAGHHAAGHAEAGAQDVQGAGQGVQGSFGLAGNHYVGMAELIMHPKSWPGGEDSWKDACDCLLNKVTEGMGQHQSYVKLPAILMLWLPWLLTTCCLFCPPPQDISYSRSINTGWKPPLKYRLMSEEEHQVGAVEGGVGWMRLLLAMIFQQPSCRNVNELGILQAGCAPGVCIMTCCWPSPICFVCLPLRPGGARPVLHHLRGRQPAAPHPQLWRHEVPARGAGGERGAQEGERGPCCGV